MTSGAISGSTTAKPRGIGLAVAYDWALGAQMLTMLVLAVGFGLAPLRSGTSNIPTAASAIGFGILAAICIGWGEMVRRGNRYGYWLQVVASAGLTLVGYLYQLPLMLRSAQQGNFWPFIPGIILTVVTPFLLIRLLNPATRAWIATVTPPESLARHGSARWIISTMLGAAIGGILVALATVH